MWWREWDGYQLAGVQRMIEVGTPFANRLKVEALKQRLLCEEPIAYFDVRYVVR